MDFGEILSKAWKTIWKHKILWLFGVLAGCGATGSGSGGGGGAQATYSGSPNSFGNGPSFLAPSTQRALEDFGRWISDIPVWVWIVVGILVTVAIIVLSIGGFMLGVLGTTGVIKGTAMADEAAEDEKPLSLGAVFKAIKPYYWKVLLFTLGFIIACLILSLIFALPIVLFTVCTCFVGLLLLIPLGWLVDLMVNFTTIAIIDEDLGIFSAIGRAWRIIIRNLGNVILMFLILGIGQLIIGLLISLPILIIPLPLIINLVVTGFQSFTVGLVLTLIFLLAFMPLVIFLGGVLKAYVLASWTLTFRRLAANTEIHPEVLSAGEIRRASIINL